mmetsp:Transcript_2405/g.5626  ORF Transcript_2405/g.5626 Transcript_2405/m.5626 type:complete len:292 (-) Transcript_2405:196-1071(-)
MDVLEGLKPLLGRHLLALALYVDNLATHEAMRTHTTTDLSYHLEYPFRRDVFGLRCDVFECEREECIARENGHVFTVNLVARRRAAPEVVVVQARQIVVDQTHRVDHLQGARGRHGLPQQSIVPHGLVLVAVRFVHELECRDAECWSDPLTASEQSVSHCLVNDFGVRFRHSGIEGLVDHFSPGLHVVLEVKVGIGCARVLRVRRHRNHRHCRDARAPATAHGHLVAVQLLHPSVSDTTVGLVSVPPLLNESRVPDDSALVSAPRAPILPPCPCSGFHPSSSSSFRACAPG